MQGIPGISGGTEHEWRAGGGGKRYCGMAFAGTRCERKGLYTFFPPGRVINAGKSQHNEDQACCEVVFVEQRPSPRGCLSSREGGGELDGVRARCFASRHTTGKMPSSRARDGTRGHVCTLGIPLVHGPCLSWLPPSSVPVGLHQGWPGQTRPTCPGGRQRWLLCWHLRGHEVSDAGLGSSQGSAVSRHPWSAAHTAPACTETRETRVTVLSW